jgi:hypothetical protein
VTHTTVVVKQSRVGNNRYAVADLSISSYTTGGEVVNSTEFGLIDIEDLLPFPAGTTGYMDMFISASSKIKIMTATGTEASGNVGVHRVRVYGH